MSKFERSVEARLLDEVYNSAEIDELLREADIPGRSKTHGKVEKINLLLEAADGETADDDCPCSLCSQRFESKAT